jgi:hypothetical protein
MTETVEAPENSEELSKAPEEAPKKTQESPKTLKNSPEKAGGEIISEVTEAPKAARGRPRGSRDSAPRVKRVPIVSDPEPPAEVKLPPARKAAKQVRVIPEEEPEPEPEPEEEEEEPEPPKSPRTLRKERVQAQAAERRAMQQAKQARFDRTLDAFMGY